MDCRDEFTTFSGLSYLSPGFKGEITYTWIWCLCSLASQSLLGYRGPLPEVRGWGRTYNLIEPGSFRERHRVTCLPTLACDQLFS